MNSKYVIYCYECADIQFDDMHNAFFPYHGYYKSTNLDNTCPEGHRDFEFINITNSEYDILRQISTDTSFFEAMMKLKEEDIIEYQSRMAQFRAQVEEQKSAKAAESAALKCPRCGSTNISTGARGVSFFWGFLGADKTVNRCAKCGHTWKPRG